LENTKLVLHASAGLTSVVDKKSKIEGEDLRRRRLRRYKIRKISEGEEFEDTRSYQKITQTSFD
jgi:hypothetical protein